jgi:predicted dienelactone hydrolase
VRVWYPAERPSSGQPALAWPEILKLGDLASADFGLPGFVAGHLNLARGHAWSDAPIAAKEGGFTILLFSPGYGGIVSQNTPQMEELASQGYVVFGIAHPYQNAVVYPDGRVTKVLDENAWRKLTPEQVKSVATRFSDISRRIMESGDAEEVRSLVEGVYALDPLLQVNIDVWLRDSQFVLDRIAALQSGAIDSPFRERLDLARIGAFGHSFGGATAGMLCLLDPRVKAGINMDGYQYGTVSGKDLGRPFLLMLSDSPLNAKVNGAIYSASTLPFWTLRIKGSTHMNYSDYSLFSPVLRLLGLTGSVDGGTMEETVSRFTLAFFDRSLRGLPAPLLDRPETNSTYEFRLGPP